jgi:hypothetical protein
MTLVREPRLHPVSIETLYPTQITVGMREVEAKRKHWRGIGKQDEFLGKHLIPVIQGYKQRYYVIDHHHLSLALHQEGVKKIAVTVIADLTMLDRDAFWTYLDNRGWVHPYDDKGRRRSYEDIPRSINGLIDDPFRSLAGELRRAGGFAKDTTPFSEFLWADFLRRRVKRVRIEKNFTRALEQALQLARSDDSSYLPGWCGALPSD